MRRTEHLLLATTAILLCACDGTPEVTVQYYLPKATTALQVAETIVCDADNRPIPTFTVNEATAYSADIDPTTGPEKFPIGKLDHWYADASVTVNLTEDGRLKGINGSETGRGEEIVKAAATLATAIAPKAITKTELSLCDEIAKAASGGARGDGGNGGGPHTMGARPGGSPGDAGAPAVPSAKSATITYETVPKVIDYAKAAKGNDDHTLKPVAGGPIAKAAADMFPLTLRIEQLVPRANGAFDSNIGSEDVIRLKLNQTAEARLDVISGSPNGGAGTKVWTKTIVVPLPGADPYDLPIPKAALFGKHTFGLTLADSGAISSISYGADSGAASSLNAASTAVTTVHGGTAADKAAHAKAQADLIYQTQRLARCRADPTNCQ